MAKNNYYQLKILNNDDFGVNEMLKMTEEQARAIDTVLDLIADNEHLSDLFGELNLKNLKPPIEVE